MRTRVHVSSRIYRVRSSFVDMPTLVYGTESLADSDTRTNLYTTEEDLIDDVTLRTAVSTGRFEDLPKMGRRQRRRPLRNAT